MGIQHRENGGGRCMNCENYCSRRESGDRDLFDTNNSLKGSDSPHEVTQEDMATPVDKEDAPAASPPPPVAPISAAPAENASTAPKQALARAKTGRAPMVEIKKKTKTKAIEGEHLNAFDFKKMYEEVQARRITVNFEMDGKEINEEKDLFQLPKKKTKRRGTSGSSYCSMNTKTNTQEMRRYLTTITTRLTTTLWSMSPKVMSPKR